MNLYNNNDIDVTKFYKRTFWMLRLYSAILSIGCFICSIVFLFLDIDKFPLKFTVFAYLFVASIGIEIFYLIITSILMRFVFREEINYKHNKNMDDKSEDTSNYITKDFENCVSKKSKRKISAQETTSVIIIVSLTALVIVALILSLVLSK